MGHPTGTGIRPETRAMSIQELNSQPPILDTVADNIVNRQLAECVFVAFDTETTGLSPVACRLVELSGVKFKGDGTEISTFQALINPEVPIPAPATAVHGITDSMVRYEEKFATVVPRFFQWALNSDVDNIDNRAVLLAHNAPFDLSFLEVALCKIGLPMPSNMVLDTLTLARQLITDSVNHQLRTLVEHLGVGSDTYHRALADSYHVRSIFLKMIESLPSDTTLGDIALIGGKYHFMDRSSPGDDSQWTTSAEFQLIREAIDNGLDLRMFYSGVRKTERVVTPRSVLFTRGLPYVTAFCHLADAERTFRIDRIVKLEAMDRQP